MRASYSIATPTLLRFNATIPAGERSKVVEQFMRIALTEREAALEKIALQFMTDPANAEALASEANWDVTVGDGLKDV
jgi:hypothetical protein